MSMAIDMSELYETVEPTSITAKDLIESGPGTVLGLIGYDALIHIREENGSTGEVQEAQVAGTVETIIIIEGGLSVKFEGTADPVAISEDDAPHVTIYSYGGI